MQAGSSPSILPTTSAPPVQLPRDYVGPVVLPGSNRHVWWTGRVAIGLRYVPDRGPAPLGEGGEWLQGILLRGR